MRAFPKIFPLILIILLAGTICGHTQNTSGQQDAPPQIITLKDGSILKGKLVDISDQTYVIDTNNLGQVKVEADKVSSIAAVPNPAQPPPPNPFAAGNMNAAFLSGFGSGFGNAPGASNTGTAAAAQASQLQSQLLSDPQVMSDIRRLVQDPEILQLLQNPQLMQTIMTMDPATIKNSPDIQRLLSNPKMKALIDKVGQQYLGTINGPAGMSNTGTR